MSEESITVVLKPEDDTEAILEKVRMAGVQQVNLIVPPGTRALQMLGGFTMLRKACDITGIDVTIYSTDEKTCDMAKVCRFDVVRLEQEGRPPEARPPVEELPRIVVSTRPPEPDRTMVAPAPVAEAPGAGRPTGVDERLRGLSDEDMALFDALESMSATEDVVLGPEALRRPPPAVPVFGEEEEAGPPAARPERPARAPSRLKRIFDPLVSALSSVVVAVVGLVVRVASRRLQKEGTVPEAAKVPAAAVAPLVQPEEDLQARRARKLRYYLWGLVGVVAFTLFVLLLYVVSLPQTVVSLTPLAAPPQEMDLSFTVALTKTVPSGAKLGPGVQGSAVTIPAQMAQVELSDKAVGQATGEAWIADAAAVGTVVFANRVEYEVFVPAGTRVSGGGATFHTTADLAVPASHFWGSDAYVSTAAVGIEADQPGSAGNVDAWAITTIEGDLSWLLNAVNEEPTSGGSERKATIITLEDQERLRQKLVTQLQVQAYSELQAKIAKLEVLSGSLEIATVEETFSAAVGEEATAITLTARVRASALATTPGLFRQAVDKAVMDKLGGQKAGQQIGGITHGAMVPVAPVGGGSSWTYRTHATVIIVNKIDSKLQADIRGALRGLTYKEAQEKLGSYRDRIAGWAISPVLGRLPRVASRIRVVDISEHLH